MGVCLQLEDRQRAEARERKEQGAEWKQKVSYYAACGGVIGNELHL